MKAIKCKKMFISAEYIYFKARHWDILHSQPTKLHSLIIMKNTISIDNNDVCDYIYSVMI